jgi:DNA-directed RNA polymerase delta subunit
MNSCRNYRKDQWHWHSLGSSMNDFISRGNRRWNLKRFYSYCEIHKLLNNFEECMIDDEKNSSILDEYADIRTGLKNKTISAITIDTTVFDDNGMRFDKGLFSQLKQFNRHPANFIISEVVLKEIRRHFTKSVNSKKERFGRDMSEAAEFVGYDQKYVHEVKEKFSELPSSEAICEKYVGSFLDESSAKVVEVDDHINLNDVLKCYFEGAPPFHPENPKKSEFPDAIALLSLEGWAIDSETEVVVVSRDADWITFCETSEKLHLVKDLATALALFQTPDEAVKAMVEDLRYKLNDSNSEIFSRIEDDIKDFDWELHAEKHADSQFHYEEEDAFVEINGCVFVDRPDAIAVTGIDDEAVSIIFSLQVEGEYIANFSFQKWDGIDKEYISMGYNEIREDFSVSVSVVLRLPNKSADPDDIEWEIEPAPLHFDFGEIEPDWITGRD